MANPPKKKGTARETATVRKAEEYAGLQAQRAPNNSPAWDVTVRAAGLGPFRLEVKDRQQLSLHKTLKDTQAANDGFPTAVLWHRTSKKGDSSRATPDGPTTVSVDQDLFFTLLSMASLLTTGFHFRDHKGVLDGVWEDTSHVVSALEDRYPHLVAGGL